MPEPKTIDTDGVKERLEDDESVVVEVLSEQNYEQGHIPGAENIPEGADDFQERFERLVPDRSTPVVVYCADTACQASPRASRRLVSMGYKEVYDYERGKAGWDEDGNKLTTSVEATT